MSDFKPMNECKGFNMERILLKNKNGYMITAYFKDGMLQCDGDLDWTRPTAYCTIFDVNNLVCPTHKTKLYKHPNGIAYCSLCNYSIKTIATLIKV